MSSSFFESLPEPFPPKIRRTEEIKLYKKITKGDEVALNELVMRNMKEAVRYAATVSRNLQPGALISLCYEALIRNAKRFDPTRQRFFAFAKPGLRGAIYRNYNKEQLPIVSADYHPRESRGAKTPVRIEGHDECEPIDAGHIVEPDMEGIFTRDRWALVKPVIDQKCSEQERMILTLSYVSGFNFQEIGDLLGVTRSAIQRTNWRAIKKIRDVITKQHICEK